MYKNWIFDWSGTLVDDMALVICATNHVMRQYGKDEYDRDSFKASFRLPYAEFYEEVLPGVPLEEIEDHFRDGFDKSPEHVPILPHAREFLQALKNVDARLFVCTSMDAKAFVIQSENLGLSEFFEETYAGVLDKRELIHDLIEKHDLHPEETVFVGDMIHDVATANHGGLASVAVLTGYNNETELASAHPTLMCRDLSSLTDIVKKQYSKRLDHPVATVGALIRNQEGGLLMIQTHKWSDKWGIPGGKIQRGETSEDALRREIKEETNLDIEEIEFVCVQDCIDSAEFERPAHFLLMNYTAMATSTEVTLNEEAERYEWVAPGKVWDYDLNIPTQVLLKQVLGK